jgi:hypothetical protein
MERLDVLLRSALDSTNRIVGSAGRFADSLGIGPMVLLALTVRRYEVRSYLLEQCLQKSRDIAKPAKLDKTTPAHAR